MLFENNDQVLLSSDNFIQFIVTRRILILPDNHSICFLPVIDCQIT